MDIVQVIEVEDSLGFVLPDAVLARLNIAAGDVVLLTETPQGIRLTPAAAEEASPPPSPVPSR